MIDGQTRMLKLGTDIIEESNNIIKYLAENYAAARELIATHNAQAEALAKSLDEHWYT